MGKFNLNDLLNNSSLAEAGAVRREMEKNEEIVKISLYDMIPSANNFYDVTKLTDLIETIPVVGVLQPMLVKPCEEEVGKYDIIAGGRRREACKYLVEHEGLAKFEKIPCIVKEADELKQDSDIMNDLILILSNRYRSISDYEKMTEIVEIEKIISKAKMRNDLLRDSIREALKKVSDSDTENMKSRDIVAAFAGTSPTQVGRYKAIYKNLCLELMNAFKDGKINVSVAYEASGVSHENQDKLANILKNDGTLTLQDVQRMKQMEKENAVIPGQTVFDPDCEVVAAEKIENGVIKEQIVLPEVKKVETKKGEASPKQNVTAQKEEVMDNVAQFAICVTGMKGTSLCETFLAIDPYVAADTVREGLLNQLLINSDKKTMTIKITIDRKDM